MIGRDTTPGIAKTLEEVVVVLVDAQEDPGTVSSESVVVAVPAAPVPVVARSATSATKWDTLHVIARRIWTGATVVTEAATLPVTAVSHLTTLAVTTATRAVIWHATARRRATGTRTCPVTIATRAVTSRGIVPPGTRAVTAVAKSVT